MNTHICKDCNTQITEAEAAAFGVCVNCRAANKPRYLGLRLAHMRNYGPKEQKQREESIVIRRLRKLHHELKTEILQAEKERRVEFQLEKWLETVAYCIEYLGVILKEA